MTPTPRPSGPRRALLALLLALAAPGLARAAPPPENRCPSLGGRPGSPAGEDALPVPLREGMVVTAGDLLRLRDLLPPELWRLREVFFHEGMRMEIGLCHRRYPVPAFYAEATARFAGTARLDDEGNLHEHVAGLPFPPDLIEPGPDAGARWAWNFEQRYRGAGPRGSFRIVDMPSRTAGPFEYRGSFFFLQTGQRADLEASGFRVPEAGDAVWIAGGRFDEPFETRHLAWRQLRPAETRRRYDKADDTFVYVPSMRKVRRAASTWVDGIFTPQYRASSGDDGGGGLAIGGDGYSGPQGAIQPTAARSAVVTENLRVGFTGLSLRPNAYRWRVLAEREVLAPLNGTREGYPTEPERNFGASGLSVASDRWDVRYAVVLDGRRREPGGAFQRIELWIDWQTQQPLYVVTKQKRGALVDVEILVHRFSGDRRDYPPWPGGQPALVFDPVAAVSYSPLAAGTGWRRESYDAVSVPGDPADTRRYTSTDFLMRGN